MMLFTLCADRLYLLTALSIEDIREQELHRQKLNYYW